jgi:hypothetical protein
MKNGGWLDSYADGGTMQEHQENYNNSEVSLPEGFVGMGNNTKGRNYSPAWGGQFQGGGRVPIYVESKNDPRYKAYQDSLNLYKENSYQQFTENNDPEIKNKLIQSRIPYNSLPELPTVKGKRVGFERKDKTADEKNKKSIIYSEKIKPEYFNLNKFIDFDDAHQLTSYYKKPQQEVKVKPTTTKRTTKPTSGYILQADGSKLYDKSIPAGKFFDPDKHLGDGPRKFQDIPQDRKPVTSVVNNLTLAGLGNNNLEIDSTNFPELRPQVRPVKDWKYIWKHAGTTQFGYVNSPEDMDHWVDWRDWYSTGGGKDKGDSVTITPEYQMGGEVYPVNYVPKAQAGRSTFQPIMPAIDFISDKLSSWFGNDEEEEAVKKPVVKNNTRTLKIVDPRKKMATTNQPLRPNVDLLTGNYSSNHLDKLMQEAKRQGLSKQDMMNLSAMGFQETKWGRSDDNIGHVLSNFKGNDYYQQFINAYKEKMKQADRLGITDPAMRLQVYNGLGTITPKTEKKYHGYEMQKIYGVPIPKGGISMKKNPLYGKQVIDVRDNVLAENPEYVQYLDSIYKAPVPGYMEDVKINKQKVPALIHDGNSGSFPKTKGFAPILDKHQMGGSIPGAVGFSYARTQSPAPSNGKYAKKTMASAQNGQEMKYYQEGLDFKPKTISKNGGWLDSYDVAQTGTQVKYGTPEYEEAYNRGEVITDEGVRSPILLDEVIVNKKSPAPGFWKQSRDRYLEEHQDDDILGAIGSVVTYPLGVAQQAMMYGLTGKVQTPTEGMGIRKGMGGFPEAVTNAVADPVMFIGELGKAPELLKSGVRALGTEEGLLSNAYRLNPNAGKLGRYNRIVGNNAIEDLNASGLVRAGNRGGRNNGNIGNVSFNRTTAWPSFGEGVPTANNVYAQEVINQGYTPHIISTNREFGVSTLGRHGKGSTMFPIDETGRYLESFPASEVNVFEGIKPHWWKGYKQIPKQEDGGVIKDDMGQWAHPGEITEIESNDITMEGVPYDVLGISDTGDTKLMKPGKNYKFKGKKVTEYPMAQGGKKIKIKDDREQTIKTKESTFVPIIKEIKKPAKVNSQIQKEIKFMKDWTNSPMYNTMLNNSTRGVADEQDIKNIRKERLNDLSIEVSNTPFFFDDDTGGSSQVATGDIKFYPTAYSDSDVFKGTPAHEISHTQDSMRNPFRNLSNTLFGTNFRTSYIPQSDINMMDKYSKSGATYDLLFNKRKDDDEWDGTRDFFKYVTTPTETRARLNSLRYIAKENNIYDPYTQKINMDQLEKLRQRSEKLGKQKGFDPYMQLNTNGGYNDEEILNMLNTISQNKQPNKTPNIAVAKNGLRQEQKGLQNLDNLTNFTNYNKPQPGGWLNKYN